jgi:hypothetical protein
MCARENGKLFKSGFFKWEMPEVRQGGAKAAFQMI